MSNPICHLILLFNLIAYNGTKAINISADKPNIYALQSPTIRQSILAFFLKNESKKWNKML